MTKRKSVKLRDVKPVSDPKGGRHHHKGGGGNRPERPDPPLRPGGMIP
jgi:hypothetical protein